MSRFRRFIGRIKFRLRGKNRVVGWTMTPDEAGMLQTVREILSGYPPKTTLVNIGATKGGIGAAYRLAKSLGFGTTGIVSSQALDYLDEISEAVDDVCFIEDEQWGGKLPDSEELSPTSKAMVACSDVLFGIGGGEISRDEMLAAREGGKPVHFYPAEVDRAWATWRAKRMNLPTPDSFWGAAHEVLGKEKK